MALISIIIPVYNCEDYLHSCFDSVMRQCYSSWELIIVDDGSTDKSGKICDEYAKLDDRIKVIHHENKGVSVARNTGMDCAKGEWITFVDADDYVSEDYLTKMIEATKNGSDLINVSRKHSSGNYVSKAAIIEKSDYIKYFFQGGYNFGYVTGKLFKRNIINKYNIRFAEGVRWAEDVIFIDNYLIHSQKATLMSDVLYHYTYRPGSGVNKLHPADAEYLGFLAACEFQPKMAEWTKESTKIYFSPYPYLQRYVLAVLHEDKSSESRLKKLKSLNFNKRDMYIRSYNRKEAIFNWLLVNKQWRIIDYIWGGR